MTDEKMTIGQKIGSFLGLGSEDDEHDTDGTSAENKAKMDMNRVFIFHPETLNDVSQMVEFLKQGTVCVVNLMNAEQDCARSIKDHMQGATFYAEGTVELLVENIFMFLPRNYESKRFQLNTKAIMMNAMREPAPVK